MTGRLDDAPAPRTIVHIEGVHFVGDLDLSDCCHEDGERLCALVLENCTFSGRIDLASAHIARLSLRGSRFPELNAAQTTIDGTLDLADVSSSEPDDGPCSVRLDGARIDGDLDLRGATLTRAPRMTLRRSGDPAIFALSATGLEISGAIYAQELTAFGGVRINDAIVGGEAWFSGASLHAEEEDAFNAQDTRFRGALIFGAMRDTERSFLATGTIWMLGATVEGPLHINRAHVPCINLSAATVKGPLRARASVIGEARDGDAFVAEGAQFGEVDFASEEIPTIITGKVKMASARIESDLVFDYVNSSASDDRARIAIDLDNAEVRGTLKMTYARIMGHIRARRMSVGGDFKLYRSMIDVGNDPNPLSAINLDQARIGGDLQFGFHPKAVHEVHGRAAQSASVAQRIYREYAGLSSNGVVELDGATIGGSLLADRCAMSAGRSPYRRVALSAINASIGLDLSLDRFRCDDDDVDLTGATIGRRLFLRPTVDPAQKDSRSTWFLDGAATGQFREWKADESWERLEAMPRLAIDGFRYRSFESAWAYSKRRRVRWLLRHAKFETRRSKHASRWRKFWTGYPYKPYVHYPSQPFVFLSLYSKKTGQIGDAAYIMIAKKQNDVKAMGFGLKKMSAWLFGALFKFGFSGARASLTLLIYYILGACAAHYADRSDLLVINSQPVTTLGGVMPDRASLVPQVEMTAARGDLPMYCRNAINPEMYALDTILPVDLGQESKCEPGTDLGTMAKALYALIGWILVSVAILTYSGILQREAEQD